MLRCTLGLLAGLVCFLAAGCSPSQGTVSGRITLDGAPLATGNVSFIPVADGPVSVGAIQGNGTYQVGAGAEGGVAPGDYVVSIVATEFVPPTPSDPDPLPKLLTPEKYGARETTDLRCTVKPGANTCDFELQSK